MLHDVAKCEKGSSTDAKNGALEGGGEDHD